MVAEMVATCMHGAIMSTIKFWIKIDAASYYSKKRSGA